MEITAWQVFGYVLAACGAVATVYLGYTFVAFLIFKRAVRDMRNNFFGRG